MDWAIKKIVLHVRRENNMSKTDTNAQKKSSKEDELEYKIDKIEEICKH